MKRTFIAVAAAALALLAAPVARASAAPASHPYLQPNAGVLLAPGVHSLPSRPLPFAHPQGLVYWGDYTITLAAMRRDGSRPCLDVDITEGGRLGNKVQVWGCNNSPQQDWSL